MSTLSSLAASLEVPRPGSSKNSKPSTPRLNNPYMVNPNKPTALIPPNRTNVAASNRLAAPNATKRVTAPAGVGGALRARRTTFNMAANRVVEQNRVEKTRKQQLAEAGADFAENTTAHGFSHIASGKRHWTYRLAWIIIMLSAVALFGYMTFTRIAVYLESTSKVTYTTTFERALDGMPLPAISICSEAFHNEFVLTDLLLDIDKHVTYYTSNPENIKELIETMFRHPAFLTHTWAPKNSIVLMVQWMRKLLISGTKKERPNGSVAQSSGPIGCNVDGCTIGWKRPSMPRTKFGGPIDPSNPVMSPGTNNRSNWYPWLSSDVFDTAYQLKSMNQIWGSDHGQQEPVPGYLGPLVYKGSFDGYSATGEKLAWRDENDHANKCTGKCCREYQIEFYDTEFWLRDGDDIYLGKKHVNRENASFVAEYILTVCSAMGENVKFEEWYTRDKNETSRPDDFELWDAEVHGAPVPSADQVFHAPNNPDGLWNHHISHTNNYFSVDMDVMFKVNDASRFGEQLIEVAEFLALNQTNHDHRESFGYRDAPLFNEKFTPIINKQSNFSQFYLPRNKAKELAKDAMRDLITGAGSYYPKVAPQGSYSYISYYDFRVKTFATNDYTVNYSSLQTMKSKIKQSEFFKAVEQNYYNTMLVNSLIPELTILQIKLAEIDVPDPFANNVIKMSVVPNFDATCIRLDFVESAIKQLEPGPKNGVQIRMQLPKAYGGSPSVVQVRRYPRLRHTFSGNMGGETIDFAPEKVFNQEVYLLVHPSDLKMPTTTSPEVAVIYLRSNKIIEAAINNVKEHYVHDPVQTNISCSAVAVPEFECLYNTITCNPLSKDTTCQPRMSPLPAIDPLGAGCVPSRCDVHRVALESLQMYDFPECVDKQPSIDFLRHDPYLMDRQKACMLTVTDSGVQELNPGPVSKYAKEMFEARNGLIEKCVQTSNFVKFDSKGEKLDEVASICEILRDHKTAYEFYEIHVGVGDMYYRMVEEVEVDTPDKLVIDIIGSLGFFMGFSFITLVEIIIFLYTICVKMVRGDDGEEDDDPKKSKA